MKVFLAAIADGVIDPRQLDPFDPRSYFRLGEILTAYREQINLRWAMFQHQRTAALMASRLIGPQMAEVAIKAEISLTNQVRYLLLHVTPEDEEEVLKGYARLWEGNFGNLSDPEVQANIDSVVAALRATREANARSA